MAPYKQGQNSSKMSLIQKISTNFRIIIQKNSIIFWISEYFHYLCRRLAALGNLKASFHCTHWHRFFPLKRAPPLTPTLSQWSLHPLRFPRFRGTETSGEREETALLGARNRYALRMADQSGPRQIVRDGTAGMLLGI